MLYRRRQAEWLGALRGTTFWKLLLLLSLSKHIQMSIVYIVYKHFNLISNTDAPFNLKVTKGCSVLFINFWNIKWHVGGLIRYPSKVLLDRGQASPHDNALHLFPLEGWNKTLNVHLAHIYRHTCIQADAGTTHINQISNLSLSSSKA